MIIHDMRLSGRIVEVRSTKQSVGIKSGAFDPDIILILLCLRFRFNRCVTANGASELYSSSAPEHCNAQVRNEPPKCCFLSYR